MLLVTCTEQYYIRRCSRTCNQEHEHVSFFTKDRIYILNSAVDASKMMSLDISKLMFIINDDDYDEIDVVDKWVKSLLIDHIYHLIDTDECKEYYFLTNNATFLRAFKECI